MKCYIFRQTGFVPYDGMLLKSYQVFLKWNTVFLDSRWKCCLLALWNSTKTTQSGLFGQGPSYVEKN